MNSLANIVPVGTFGLAGQYYSMQGSVLAKTIAVFPPLMSP